MCRELTLLSSHSATECTVAVIPGFVPFLFQLSLFSPVLRSSTGSICLLDVMASVWEFYFSAVTVWFFVLIYFKSIVIVVEAFFRYGHGISYFCHGCDRMPDKKALIDLQFRSLSVAGAGWLAGHIISTVKKPSGNCHSAHFLFILFI